VTTIQTATHGSEGGHWYTKSHELVETVQGKQGMVEPTLRHARQLQLAPGVTTILRMADKPALNVYFVKQAIMAALTLPRKDGEDDDSYVARVIKDSKEAGRKAAEAGTKIHAEVQHANDDIAIPSAHAMAVRNYLHMAFGDRKWLSEAVCTSLLGYGTKADLHTEDGLLLDIKTKDDVDPFEMVTFGDQWEQLAATEQALIGRFGYQPFKVRGILYVSRTVPTDIVLKEISEQEYQEGWQRFKLLLAYWQVSKRYRPEWATCTS